MWSTPSATSSWIRSMSSGVGVESEIRLAGIVTPGWPWTRPPLTTAQTASSPRRPTTTSETPPSPMATRSPSSRSATASSSATPTRAAVLDRAAEPGSEHGLGAGRERDPAVGEARAADFRPGQVGEHRDLRDDGPDPPDARDRLRHRRVGERAPGRRPSPPWPSRRGFRRCPTPGRSSRQSSCAAGVRDSPRPASPRTNAFAAGLRRTRAARGVVPEGFMSLACPTGHAHRLRRAAIVGRSARRADRAHVEFGDPQPGHRRAVRPFMPLPRERPLGPARLDRPAESVEGALVEPEVVDRGRHLAVLDEVDAVAGESRQEQRRAVDLPDVPQAGEEEPSLGVGDEVVESSPARRAGPAAGCRPAGRRGRPERRAPAR